VRRRLLNLLTVLSLLLCLAVAALWVRSYFAADRFVRLPLTLRPGGFRTEEYTAFAWRGVLGVGAIRHDHEQASMPAAQYDPLLLIAQSRDAQWQFEGSWSSRPPQDFPATGGSLPLWGFDTWTVNERGLGHRGLGAGLNIAYWLLLLLCSVPLDLWVIATMFGRRRLGRGRCVRCGYDLRATPDRCPECGHVGEAAVATRGEGR
jgi:hypothetical protein